jgi:hypothetical protein
VTQLGFNTVFANPSDNPSGPTGPTGHCGPYHQPAGEPLPLFTIHTNHHGGHASHLPARQHPADKATPTPVYLTHPKEGMNLIFAFVLEN